MPRWRLSVGALLLLGLGLPLLLPFVDLVRHPQAWLVWRDAARIVELSRNTVALISGTLLIALPLGIAGAVLLYRSDLPGRRFLRALTILALFIPLPLFASAWQATLGTTGWLPMLVGTAPADVSQTSIPWRPWAQGLWPAIWVHAAAGLPWVIWIVGQGLCRVERELEEDALLAASPWAVLWALTLPRCRAALFAAGLWVALQTATEITVSDIMVVRTFAEEVYLQFVLPESHLALARAVAVSAPAIALTVLLVLWAARGWERSLPPLEQVSEPICLFHLGRLRGAWLAAILIGTAILLGVPIVSLVWKAGLGGSPEAWSGRTVGFHLWSVLPFHGRLIGESLLVAAVAGLIAAALALVSCWLALESPGFRTGVLVLMAVAWAMPGPLLGIGMKEAIHLLMDGEQGIATLFGWSGTLPLKAALYEGPSLVPIVWASVIRFYPAAVALLWPAVRMIPRELRDALRVDGARPLDELRWLTWPLSADAAGRAFLAVAVLSLGELSAGKLVETPGSRTFAHFIFEQMHYKLANQLAALCLVLLALIALGGGLLALLTILPPRSRTPPAAARSAVAAGRCGPPPR